MIGDNFVQISPSDRWVIDGDGYVAGVQRQQQSDKQGRFLRPEQMPGVPLGAFGGGGRIALMGDSETQINGASQACTLAIFDRLTNRLALTVSSHNTWIGDVYDLYNRSYVSLYDLMHVPVVDITSSSIFVVQLPGGIGMYPDLPNGTALTSTAGLNRPVYKCAKGWFTQMCMRHGQRWEAVIDSSQSGDRVFDVYRRLHKEMALWRQLGVTGVVMHMPGINDMTPSSTTPYDDLHRTWQDTVALLDDIRMAGYPIIISTIMPVASGEASARDRTWQTAAAHQLVRLHMEYASRFSDRVFILDAWGFVVDPATGIATVGYMNTADKLHWSNVGAYRFINSNEAKITNKFGDYVSSLPQSILDTRTAARVLGPLTFTGSLSGVASATLTAAFSGPTFTDYTIVFSDGTVKTDGHLTNGSTAVTWTGNVTASASAGCYRAAIDNNGLVTVSGQGFGLQKNQEMFSTGATGVYGPSICTGVNGRQTIIATDSTTQFRFQTSITGQAGTITGTLFFTTCRQLFPDPLLQTTTGGTANAGGTLTATKIAGQLAVTLNQVSDPADIVATADVVAAASGIGNEQQIVVSAAINGTKVRVSFKATTTTINPYLAPGRTYVMEAWIRYTTAADWANSTLGRFEFYAQPTANAPQSETWAMYDSQSPSSDSSLTCLFASGEPLTREFHCRTGKLTIPDGYNVNSWQLNWYSYFHDTLGETLTMGISQIAVWDVTSDGPELVALLRYL